MNELENQINTIVEDAHGFFLTSDEIEQRLETKPERDELASALSALENDGRVMRTRKGKYSLPSAFGYTAGRFQATGRGFGFVVQDGGGEDLFIPPRQTGDAWHGDRVLARRDASGRGGSHAGAVIERVISRGNRMVTGEIVRNGKQFYLCPDNGRLPEQIFIPAARLNGAGEGDKAVASITSYGTPRRGPEGEVERVLGRHGERGASIAAILYERGIEREFSPAALAAAKAAPKEVAISDLNGRVDLRDKLIFTIDGKDAKDLDDAVSLETDDRGRLILGVHIADVGHYVPENSAVDGDAFSRGMSVYFADQVIPMLPVELSNGICSLNAKVDRLTMSVFMTMDGDGAVIDHSFSQSVIRSSERMTYSDCNRLLAGGDAKLESRYADIIPTLRTMSELAKTLEKRRRNRGGLDIETVEGKIVCDETGRPVDVIARPRGVSEGIIEEFMLAANETVAEHFFWLEKPMIYRVHEKPSPDKIEAFTALAATFGYSIRAGADSYALQAVLDGAKGRPEEAVINSALLHSLMKAKYSAENLGHFGLAAKFYCHFTSPIRRYPDLVVHRFLKQLITGEMKGGAEIKAGLFALRAAEHCSVREVAAENTEREVEKLYKAEFMQGHVGEQFEGVVSGIQGFGIFVMLENTVEGLVPLESLEGDYFAYDELNKTLTGVNSKKQYKFGMKLRVECVSANPQSGQINFRLTEEIRA